MKIPVSRTSQDAKLPAYQTNGATGADLHACINTPIELKPMERTLVPTGIAIALPTGYEGQIRARSGLANKYGIALVNGIGTIDTDYRGEISVLLINLGSETFIIEPNMRIAQLVVTSHERIEWVENDALNKTKRAEDGFGSTGTGV